jgi:hypothetical protein
MDLNHESHLEQKEENRLDELQEELNALNKRLMKCGDDIALALMKENIKEVYKNEDDK